MTPRGRNILPAAVLLAALAATAGCASGGDKRVENREPPKSRTGVDDPTVGIPIGNLFGGGGGGGNRQAEAQIGVNSLLWRATLDTLAFMPLALADSNGGVILTDWYADPRTPNERFKLQVYILDTRLRADGIKVNVFKQVQGAGGWADAAVNDDTSIQIENAILTRARQLRLSTIEKK